MAALATFAFALVATSAAAEEGPAANADGTTITGSYQNPDGSPMFAFGLHLTAPDPLAQNITNLDCGPGTTTKMQGGPDKTPECLTSSPVTSFTFTITGAQPWADVVRATDPNATSLQIPPYYSLDNATYVFGQPGQFIVVQLPAIVVPPASDSVSSSSSAAQKAGPGIVRVRISGSSKRPLWGLLFGVGLVAVGAGTLVKHKEEDRDAAGALLDSFVKLGPGQSDVVSVDDVRHRFDELQVQLATTVNNELSALAQFDAAYAAAWADAMKASEAYVHDFRPIVSDLKKIWDAFPDRDWAVARAKYTEDIINYTMAIHGAGKGVIGFYKYLGAAEAAYAATYAEGTALKAASAFTKAGQPVALIGDVEKAGQEAKAFLAANQAKALAAEEQAVKVGAQLRADAAAIDREATLLSQAAKAQAQARATAAGARTPTEVNKAIQNYFGNSLSPEGKSLGNAAQWHLGADADEATKVLQAAGDTAPYDGSPFHTRATNNLVIGPKYAKDPTYLVHEGLHAHSQHIPTRLGTGMTEALTDGFTAEIIGPQNMSGGMYQDLGWTKAGQQMINLAPEEAKAFYGGTGTEQAFANAIDNKLGAGTYDQVKNLIEPVTDSSGEVLFNETKANVTKARLLLSGVK
jgi:hypothetical protein